MQGEAGVGCEGAGKTFAGAGQIQIFRVRGGSKRKIRTRAGLWWVAATWVVRNVEAGGKG